MATVPQKNRISVCEDADMDGIAKMGYQEEREETLQGIKDLMLRGRGGGRAVKYQYRTCQPEEQAKQGRLSYHQHGLPTWA